MLRDYVFLPPIPDGKDGQDSKPYRRTAGSTVSTVGFHACALIGISTLGSTQGSKADLGTLQNTARRNLKLEHKGGGELKASRKDCPKSDTWFIDGGRCGWAHECEGCECNPERGDKKCDVTITSCRRCDLPLAPETDRCPCCGMTRPDPAREAQIDRRIHHMRQIHEIECGMTDLQRRELITHGRYILERDRGEAVGFGMGEK